MPGSVKCENIFTYHKITENSRGFAVQISSLGSIYVAEETSKNHESLAGRQVGKLDSPRSDGPGKDGAGRMRPGRGLAGPDGPLFKANERSRGVAEHFPREGGITNP